MSRREHRGWPDPIVEEIRAVRQRIWEEGGGTAEGFFRRIRELSEQYRQAEQKPKPRRKAGTPRPRGKQSRT
jgi:hypothetical protein